MFSKATKPHSIAAELVLLFTLAAAVLLSCALGGFYWLVVRHAIEEDNAVLAERIRAVQSALQDPGGIKQLREELENRRVDQPSVYWIRVLDEQSNPELESPRMSQVLPPAVFSTAGSTPSHSGTYRAGQRLFSLVRLSDRADGKTYTLQVAQDRSEDERFRRRFGLLLLATGLVGTCAFAVIAVTVTRRGLRPLHEMAQLAGRVSPTHLAERINQRGWPREIQPLAAAFDDMLTRLEDAFTRLSRFSADLAHELRTPVANMLGEAQVALTRPRPAEEYREIIESSVAECEHLSRIIDNLLFVARAEAADGQAQKTSFDAEPVLAKVMAMYEPIADEQKIAIQLDAKGEIYADPGLFERAVSNLLDNALRYTLAGGSVSISTAAGPDYSEVSVKDTGCGIPTEHLPHVFDRFYRADSSRSSEGTGLGLALVKSIVDLHGGAVAVSSQVNRGTTVTVTFPTKAALEAKS